MRHGSPHHIPAPSACLGCDVLFLLCDTFRTQLGAPLQVQVSSEWSPAGTEEKLGTGYILASVCDKAD